MNRTSDSAPLNLTFDCTTFIAHILASHPSSKVCTKSILSVDEALYGSDNTFYKLKCQFHWISYTILLGSLYLIHKCIVTSTQGFINIQYGLFAHLGMWLWSPNVFGEHRWTECQIMIIVTNTLKQFITWDLKDEFLLCEASALFLQVLQLGHMEHLHTKVASTRRTCLMQSAKCWVFVIGYAGSQRGSHWSGRFDE